MYILFFDIPSWVGFFLLILSALVGWWGIQRIRAQNRYRALDAIQHGDERALAVARPPDSLYDFYIDVFKQEIVLKWYERIAILWRRYRSGFGERQAAEEIAALEAEKTQSQLYADADEHGLRGSQARRTRWNLWKEEPEKVAEKSEGNQPKNSEQPKYESEAHEKSERVLQNERDKQRYKEAGITEDSENPEFRRQWQKLQNEFEADIHEIGEKWRRRLRRQ